MRLSSVPSRICGRWQITSGVAESSGHESCAAGGIEIRSRAVYRVCRSITQAHAVENVLQFIRVSVKGGQFFPRLLSRLQHGLDRFEILGARKGSELEADAVVVIEVNRVANDAVDWPNVRYAGSLEPMHRRFEIPSRDVECAMLHRAEQVPIGLPSSLGMLEERNRAVVAHIEKVVPQFPDGRLAGARLAGCRGRAHGMYQPDSEEAAIECAGRGPVI